MPRIPPGRIDEVLQESWDDACAATEAQDPNAPTQSRWQAAPVAGSLQERFQNAYRAQVLAYDAGNTGAVRSTRRLVTVEAAIQRAVTRGPKTLMAQRVGS